MKDKYYIKNLTKENIEDYYTVIENSDDDWIFHNLDLCEIYAYRKKAENKTIIIYDKENKPIGALPIFKYRLKTNRFIKRTILESFDQSGPAIIRTLSESSRKKVLRFIEKKSIELSYKEKIDNIIISSANLSHRNIESNLSFTNPLHEFRHFNNIPTAYYYMNFSKSESSLFENLETRTKTVIRNFKKKSLDSYRIRRADNFDLEGLWQLYCQTRERTKLPYHPKEELKFYLNHKHCNFYIASYEGKPVCAIKSRIKKIVKKFL